jgi:molybdopterin converting factor small subunit
MVAVNEEFQEHDFVLSDRDEVALIPPVSGGSV